MSDSFIVYPQPGEEPIEVPRVDPEAEGARLRSFLKQALHAELCEKGPLDAVRTD